MACLFSCILKLIRCDPNLLLASLCTRSILTREGPIIKALDCNAAVTSRDALSKTVYARLFDWFAFTCFIPSFSGCLINALHFCLKFSFNASVRLVDKINRSVGQDPNSRFKIGVLDIYGFECFKSNRLVLFCLSSQLFFFPFPALSIASFIDAPCKLYLGWCISVDLVYF